MHDHAGETPAGAGERLIYSLGLSEESPREGSEDGPRGGGAPGAPEPPRLRKRPFGYKRADVDEALETRDSQVAELRQDIAALWLAFAQHDRMIRDLGGAPRAAGTSPEPPLEHEGAALQGASETADDTPAESASAVEGAEAIGQQLSDLDEVLAAIEMATQTLERSYAEEIAVAEDDPKQAEEAASEADEPER